MVKRKDMASEEEKDVSGGDVGASAHTNYSSSDDGSGGDGSGIRSKRARLSTSAAPSHAHTPSPTGHTSSTLGTLTRDGRVMRHILRFLDERAIFSCAALVSRQFSNWAYDTVGRLVIRGEDIATDGDAEPVLSTLMDMLSRLRQLKSLTLDGFTAASAPLGRHQHHQKGEEGDGKDEDEEGEDTGGPEGVNTLHRVLKESGVQNTLCELHLRMISVRGRGEISVRDMPHLTHLTLSFMGKQRPSWRSLTVQDLPSLQAVLLNDCVMPKRTTFRRVPQLEELAFEGCDRLSDGRLLTVLSQFDNRLAQCAAQLATAVQDSTPVPSQSQSLSMSSSQTSTDMASPTRNEVLNTLKILPQTEMAGRKLKKLVLNQCQPVSQPIIMVDTLEDLRINNCGSISVPFIRCDRLQKLHIVYCPHLQNLLLGCDSLKHIDLHMSGKDEQTVRMLKGSARPPHEKITPRQAILSAIQQHYGKGNISINM